MFFNKPVYKLLFLFGIKEKNISKAEEEKFIKKYFKILKSFYSKLLINIKNDYYKIELYDFIISLAKCKDHDNVIYN